MSRASSNGSGRHDKFHRQASDKAGSSELLTFVKDFADSVVRRMATGHLEEAVMEWALYRSNGNNSLRAIYLDRERLPDKTLGKYIEIPDRQRDCALHIAWVTAGHRAEWLDAPPKVFREEAQKRGVEPVDKSLVSEAFTFNRMRATIASDTGYDIIPVPSPTGEMFCDSTEHFARKRQPSPAYRAFCEQWKVAHSAESKEEEVARATIARINKVRLSDYKSWRKSAAAQTSGTPSLEALKASETSSSKGASGAPAEEAYSTTTTTSTGTGTATARAREPEPSVMTPAQDLAQKMGIDPKAAETILRDSRKAEPSVTVDELVVLATMKRDQIAGSIRHGKVTNLVGLLIKAIPNMVSGPDLNEARRRIQQQARQAQTEVEQADVCQQCSDTGFTDGFAWSTLQEAKAHWDAGGRLCSCPAGQQVKQFVGGES